MFVLDNKFHLVYRKDPYYPFAERAAQDVDPHADEQSSLVENQAGDAPVAQQHAEQTRTSSQAWSRIKPAMRQWPSSMPSKRGRAVKLGRESSRRCASGPAA